MNIILTFIMTIIFGYLFGLVIVTLIDNRLNKLNIENFSSKTISEENKNKFTEKSEQSEQSEKSEQLEESEKKYSTTNCSSSNKPTLVETNTINFKTGEKELNYNLDTDYNNSMCNSKVEGFADLPSYKGWTFERREMIICYKNHLHVKDGKSTMCTYGVTNYADPKDMSPMDLKMFMLNYPSNMTLQDYINWLYSYLDKEDELPYNHLKNLEKLKAGKKLIPEEGVLPPPSYNYPPMSAEDYFDKMYNVKNEFNIAGPLNSPTGPMLGYNYNEYSEFSQNTDVNGTSGEIRNPDISLKNNARKLKDFVEPKDSFFMKETDENNIYRIKKNEV